MLATKPHGSRTKGVRNVPALNLPFITATQVQFSQQATDPSSSSIHSYNCDIPLFRRPPAQRNIRTPGCEQLHINVESGISAGNKRTIRPNDTFSPDRAHRRPRLEQPITASENSGELPPAFGSSLLVVDPLEDLRYVVKQMSITPLSSGSSKHSSTAIRSSGSIAAGSPLHKIRLEFSDDVLEVQERLGEGASGVVHKVQDKRESGKVYARKTITTREVAVRRIVRELNIISTTSHVNIVQCFGAYMSPSSSEVKIVMEYCEGGSLEAVGKKMKESGAIVAEKIAGGIAEGVSNSFLSLSDVAYYIM